MASLVDYLKQQGMGSSFRDRQDLYSQYGMQGDYTGSAQQNMALLNRAMQNSNAGEFNMLDALSVDNSNAELGMGVPYNPNYTPKKNLVSSLPEGNIYADRANETFPVIENGQINTPYQRIEHQKNLMNAGIDVGMPQQMEFRRPEQTFSAGDYMQKMPDAPTMKPMGLLGRARHGLQNWANNISMEEAANISKTFSGASSWLPKFGGKQ